MSSISKKIQMGVSPKFPSLAGATQVQSHGLGQGYVSGLFVSPDEDKFAITLPLPDDVRNYTMSAAGDITTETVTSTIADVMTNDPQSIYMGPVGEGTRTWVGQRSSKNVREMTNSTAWETTTATGTLYTTLGSTIDTTPALWFSDDGLYFFRGFDFSLDRFPLSTAWDLSTAGTVSTVDMTNKVNALTKISRVWIHSSGKRAFLTDQTNIEEFNLTTPYDFSSAFYTGNSITSLNRIDAISVVGKNLYTVQGTVHGDGTFRKFTLNEA